MDKSSKFKFLLEQGAGKTKHSGRTLYNHLTGVYSLLYGWGCHPIICDAGLYHSIYGTEYFKPKTLTLEQRPIVREIIGHEAEQLAYLFCTVLNRFPSFQAMAGPNRRMLMQIEYANQMEQHNQGDGSWDDPSYHEYLNENMIPEKERLDFYDGRSI